jgi:hypothetical protein
MCWLLAVALGLVVVGCGGRQEPQKPATPAVETTCVEGINCDKPQPARDCEAAGPGFRTCVRDHQPTIERRNGETWTVVAGPLRHNDWSTQWGPKVWLSPDHETLLAEWDFPCDSAVAVFIPLDGGTPRVVTGQRDWRKAPISRPLGWTSTGLARITIFGKRGVKLIDPKDVVRVEVPRSSC